MTAPLRALLPSDEELGAAAQEVLGLGDHGYLLLALVRWAAELSVRIDALPLVELQKMGEAIEGHPLLRRVFGNAFG